MSSDASSTGHEPPRPEATVEDHRSPAVRRVDLVRSALGAVRAAPTLNVDPRTSAALTALEDAAAALLLQHRPDLCPRHAEGT